MLLPSESIGIEPPSTNMCRSTPMQSPSFSTRVEPPGLRNKQLADLGITEVNLGDKEFADLEFNAALIAEDKADRTVEDGSVSGLSKVVAVDILSEVVGTPTSNFRADSECSEVEDHGQHQHRHWDFFLSHKQSNAQDTVQNLMMILTARLPGVSFWLDVEQDPTEKGMRHGVQNSKDVLIYLTTGLVESKYCQMEMRWALEFEKNIILVMETDERHGKPSIDTLITSCPPDLKHIFAENVIIPWYRDPEFREISVEKIIRARSVKKAGPTVLAESTTKLKFMTRSKSCDSGGGDVFDWTFVYFTVLCGVALPGAGKKTKAWSMAVRIILLTCGCMCLSRVFTTEGPAFWDTGTIVQIVVAHPIVFLFLHVTLAILKSPLIADLLENRIDAPVEAKLLRLKTRIGTCVAALLTVSLSFWGWAAYLPAFFDMYYLESASQQRPATLLMFGLAHGLTWVLILPLFFGSLFASLLMMFVLQELSFMALLTSFNELGPEFTRTGITATVATNSGLNINELDLYHFQVSFIENWKIYKALQWRASIPFVVFWFLEFWLMSWSLWSLSQGFEADPSDPRVDRLRENWFLRVRLSWFLGSSLWFGAGAWIVALTPFGVSYYAWRMEMQSKQILFTHPGLRHSFLAFLAGFDLNFRVLLLHATVRLLPLYVCILIVNTVGFDADAVRIWRAV
ncbi:unnamed protein product [Polarella glacialis]|uniref:TIR domain-containing protein n=1 Tax=Polarella glacialis TaxID=89957 RepID=A0A813KW73_POLGL|nr:unnamed protein product [Polarella glacialis]